ncbi:hypothetical protein BH11PSE11_BH11PSE11_11750 [soil metagenome]
MTVTRKPAAKPAVARRKTAPKAKSASKPKLAVKAATLPKARPAATAKPAVKPAVTVAKPSGGGAAAGAMPAKIASKPKLPAQTKPAPRDKVKKSKLVRDSFTMPESEYQVLGDVKKACLKQGIAVKKSELLRVGIALIRGLDPASLKKALAELAPLKAGRPKKEK